MSRFRLQFGMEEFLIRTDQLGNRALIDRISALMLQLATKRVELCRNMCGLMNTFESYCQTIEPHLAWNKLAPSRSARSLGLYPD